MANEFLTTYGLDAEQREARRRLDVREARRMKMHVDDRSRDSGLRRLELIEVLGIDGKRTPLGPAVRSA